MSTDFSYAPIDDYEIVDDDYPDEPYDYPDEPIDGCNCASCKQSRGDNEELDLANSEPWIYATLFRDFGYKMNSSDARNGNVDLYYHGWGGTVEDIRARFGDRPSRSGAENHRPMVDRWTRVPIGYRSDPIYWINGRGIGQE